MSWQDWGAIGELISAVAILVTLIYLSIQIKYARIAATDASRANRRAGIHEINSLTVTNPEFRKAWLKSAGPELSGMYQDWAEELNITIDESASLMVVVADWLWLHWAQFRSMKTPEDEAELRNIVSTWYSINPMKAFVSHEGFRTFFDAEFIAFVDAAVASAKSSNA